MLYKVTWIIDLDAESFEEAARKALAIQRNPESIATHFIVKDEKGHTREVDLWQEEEKAPSLQVHVCVSKEEGIVHDVEVFTSEESARQYERQWLVEHDLENEKDREQASDFGTGIAIWGCEVKI